MKLEVCEEFALRKIHEFGLEGWWFEFSKTKSALGDCTPGIKRIRVSKHHIQGSEDEDIKDTVLHEIAHALDYERHGSTSHGPKWKRICLEVGAKPQRTKSNAYTIAKPQNKYTAICPNCGPLGGLNRKTKDAHYRCARCKTIVTLKQNY